MTTTATRAPRWAAWLVPLVVLGAAGALLWSRDPSAALRSVPPAEALVVERAKLEPGVVELSVRNDGPDPVQISQVLVDDAYWDFTASRDVVGRLGTSVVRLEYPWREAVPLTISVMTSTGLTFEHHIESPAVTPALGVETLAVYAALGLYIGVIPVAAGLLWFPAIAAWSRRRLLFLLALTAGLLAFLLVDTVEEGVELSGETASALNGLGLFFVGALVAVAVLTAMAGRPAGAARRSALGLAYLIAAGIGLHNLGEGLAVAAALATGEVALGKSLIIGFALHNTTEGLAIVAPLGREDRRPAIRHFIFLGLVAGLPTIAGAWLGGFAFVPAFGALAFGVAAGAIAQVLWSLYPMLADGAREHAMTAAAGFTLGLVVMYATGLMAG